MRIHSLTPGIVRKSGPVPLIKEGLCPITPNPDKPERIATKAPRHKQ
jgi:hypothetical protein